MNLTSTRALASLCTVGLLAVGGTAQSIADAFERVKTSVVTIHSTEIGMTARSRGQVTTTSGLGSGVLISEDGKILTAAHVVQTADRLSVEFLDGSRQRAEVVASEPMADVALLQLSGRVPAGTAVAALGDSDAVRVGEQVFVVGAPLGISHTLTVGYLSARRPVPGGEGRLQTELLQTDAAINKGNSGGPLFDLQGHVIGVVSQIASQSGGSEGMGFAVTSAVAKRLLLDRPRFWTGTDVIMLTGEMAGVFNIPDGGSGLLVQRVARNSPAQTLGLEGGEIVAKISGREILIGGDIIVAVLGVAVTRESFPGISERLTEVEPGDDVIVTVLRAGRLVELKAKLDG